MKSNEDEEDSLKFNGSIDTLERINSLMNDIIFYGANSNYYALRCNLRQLKKIARCFLDKKEREKCDKDWRDIEKLEIKYNESEDKYIFNDNVPTELFKFDEWLTYKLHKKKVTFAGSIKILHGTSKLRKKYNIE